MKKVSERFEDRKIYVTMKIPNEEIAYIYSQQIRGWFDRIVMGADKGELHRAILERDTESAEKYLCALLGKTISYFDFEESFYHGFLLSLLYGVPGYETYSNREAGNGRPDIVLYPLNPKDPVIIFELKIRKAFNRMDDGLQEAYKQIRDQRYAEGITDEGYAGCVAYGVCFCKKSCIIGKYTE